MTALNIQPTASSLSEYSSGFIPSLCKLVGAIAQMDGVITTEEYAAVVETSKSISGFSDHPLLVNTLILHFLLEKVSFSSALRELAEESKNQDKDTRQAVFESIMPILSLQGKNSNKVILDVAKSLDTMDVAHARLGDAISNKFEFRLFLKNLLNIKSELDKAKEFALIFDKKELLTVLNEHNENQPLSKLAKEKINIAKKEIAERIDTLERNNPALSIHDNAAEQILNLSKVLVEQLKQRLKTISQRAERQKKHFKEDLTAFLENAKIEITASMKNRMGSSDYTNKVVWDNFASSETARILQHRYEKLYSRYEEFMTDWIQEYDVFAKEISISQSTILSTLSRSEVIKLVPPVSAKFNIFSNFDTISSNIIKISLTSSAIAVGAVGIGVIKATVIASLVATPIGFGIAGFVALAGIYKLFSQPDVRVMNEINDITGKTVDNLVKMLGDPENTHNKAMDDIVRQFHKIAEETSASIVKNANLVLLNKEYQHNVIKKMSNNTVNYINSLLL